MCGQPLSVHVPPIPVTGSSARIAHQTLRYNVHPISYLYLSCVLPACVTYMRNSCLMLFTILASHRYLYFQPPFHASLAFQALLYRPCDTESILLLPYSQRGYDVWGCYMSPVADAYGKEGLAPVRDRLQMCQLAAADTANVMVTNWEASQLGYTRTLQVRWTLNSVQAAKKLHTVSHSAHVREFTASLV